MEPGLFIKGVVIGFSIAAPVGPIGVLCIMRTLNGGRASGLLTGLGAATADGVYGCLAGFGVTFVAGFLVEQEAWLRFAGGVFLVYLGVGSFLRKPSEAAASGDNRGLLSDYGSTVLLTLTNPMTVFSFGAVFASFGIAPDRDGYLGATVLIGGIVSGSALWWIILSLGVDFFRDRLAPAHLGLINRAAGAVIGGFGLAALVTLLV